ncbi:hypothetical protein ACFLWR_03105 [Chloroflexota bacterium]
MSSQRKWYGGISEQLNQLKDTMDEKDYKKYKLKLLLCVAQRVTEFSPECGQCQIAQQAISTLTQDIGNLIQTDDKGRRKSHIKAINAIVGHLQKQHKMVTEGYYMGIGLTIGSGIGVSLGAVMDNIGSGLPLGIGIGMAIGAALDAKAKKEDRIICPSEKTASSSRKSKVLLATGIGILAAGSLIAFFLFKNTG